MIVGISSTTESMRRFINRVDYEKPILIGGEPGVGKKFLAVNIIKSYEKDIRNPFEHIVFVEDSIQEFAGGNIYITTGKKLFDTLEPRFASSLWISPLRERIEDIPIFIEYFLSNAGRDETWYKKDDLNKLLSYWWPYNVCELKRVLTEPDGWKMLPYSRLRDILAHYSATTVLSIKMENFWNEFENDMNAGSFYQLFMETVDKEFIKSALKRCNNSKKDTANLLDIHRNTLIQKIKKLGIKS